MNLLGVVVTALGGATIISVATARWFAGRVADRLYLKWKHDYEIEAERFRDQLSTTRLVLETALASASQVQGAAQERILKAVETLWGTVVELGDLALKNLILFELLDPKEYQLAFTKSNLAALLPQMSETELGDMIEQTGKKCEPLRPFLGERLWSLFWVYRAVIGRLCVKIVRGRDKRKIYGWDFDMNGEPDEYLIKLLGFALSEDEIKTLSQSRSVAKLLKTLFEQKILLEAEGRISGRHMAEINVAEGQHLREALLSADRLAESSA